MKSNLSLTGTIKSHKIQQLMFFEFVHSLKWEKKFLNTLQRFTPNYWVSKKPNAIRNRWRTPLILPWSYLKRDFFQILTPYIISSSNDPEGNNLLPIGRSPQYDSKDVTYFIFLRIHNSTRPKRSSFYSYPPLCRLSSSSFENRPSHLRSSLMPGLWCMYSVINNYVIIHAGTEFRGSVGLLQNFPEYTPPFSDLNNVPLFLDD